MTYHIDNGKGSMATTECPNKAAGIALDFYRSGCEDVKVTIKGIYGKYHSEPGAIYEASYDWEKAIEQLMG